jgi:hypothetical protein
MAKQMLKPKLLVRILIQLVIYAGVFFLPAGTLSWWRAWVFLGLTGVVGTALTVCRPVPCVW